MRFVCVMVFWCFACGTNTFDGTWRGTATVWAAAGQQGAYETAVAIITDGHDVAIEQICPDASGAILAQSVNRALTWSGAFACPAPADTMTICPGAHIDNTALHGVVSESGTHLVMSLRGVMEGCGAPTAVRTSLRLVRDP